MKDHQKPKKCPDCGLAAPRIVPEDVAGVFHQDVTGPVPQNTGISQLDSHIDRVIGKSADQGRQVQEQRKRIKEQVLRSNPGKSLEDLSLNPDGSYKVLAPEERGVQSRVHSINDLAMKTLKKSKSKTDAP